MLDADDPQNGIDVVYMRPRRAVRRRCWAGDARRAPPPGRPTPQALHQVLLTLEDSLDGEHPEPCRSCSPTTSPRARSARAGRASEAVYGDLLADRDDPEYHRPGHLAVRAAALVTQPMLERS